VDVLPPKQAAFVREYLVDLNATQAAIRAKYSKNGARQQGARLLANAAIRAAIDAASQKVAAKLEITVERIESELARYAFAPANSAAPGEFLDCEPRDRLKALELLGKRHAMFTENHRHSFEDMTDEALEAKYREAIAKGSASITRPPA
jgi:hypothetical protein